jgi:hypothetical protein
MKQATALPSISQPSKDNIEMFLLLEHPTRLLSSQCRPPWNPSLVYKPELPNSFSTSESSLSVNMRRMWGRIRTIQQDEMIRQEFNDSVEAVLWERAAKKVKEKGKVMTRKQREKQFLGFQSRQHRKEHMFEIPEIYRRYLTPKQNVANRVGHQTWQQKTPKQAGTSGTDFHFPGFWFSQPTTFTIAMHCMLQ